MPILESGSISRCLGLGPPALMFLVLFEEFLPGVLEETFMARKSFGMLSKSMKHFLAFASATSAAQYSDCTRALALPTTWKTTNTISTIA
jgi:hypothetical protein